MSTQVVESIQDAAVVGEAGLAALHARVAGRFARPEVRARARRSLGGLLGRAERKKECMTFCGGPAPAPPDPP